MKKHFFLILFSCLLFSFGKAGTGDSCVNPRSLGNQDTCLYNVFTNGPTYWFSFTAQTSYVQISIASHVGGGVGKVRRVYAIQSCGFAPFDSADVNGNDSIYFSLYNLTPSTTYIIAASTVAGCGGGCNPKASFDICLKNNPSPTSTACPWPGPYPPCGEQVGNGGFEYIDPTWNGGCPFDISLPTDPNTVACPWIGMPLPCFVNSTPDFFNTCATTNGYPNTSVPSNYFGSENPHGGNGYTGIVTYSQYPSCAPFEGLMQNYQAPLIANKVYYEEMWVSLADGSNMASTIGFTSFPPGSLNDWYNPTPITTTSGWVQLAHCFTAVGGEAYFAITASGTTVTPIAVTPISGYPFSNPTYPTAYYYVDDVSVRPLAYAGGPTMNVCNCATVGCSPANPIPGATYTWTSSPSTGVVFSTPNNITSNVCFPAAGTYTLTLTVNWQSCSATDQIIITNTGFSTTANATPQTICIGGSSTVSVTTTGGSSPFTYSWAPVSSTSSSVSVSPTTTTTYTVYVADANGCTGTATVTVTVSAPVVTITPPATDNTCSTSIYTANPSGGIGPYSYSWSTSGNGTIQGSNTNSTLTVLWNGVGVGTVTVVITDAAGCTATVTINIPPCCVNPQQNGINHVTISNMNVTQFIATGNPQITGSTYQNNFGGSGSIYINGTFTIDQNFRFYQSNVFFGPNARIVIPPSASATLTIECSNFAAGCNYMWDGIFVQNTNNLVVIKNSCGQQMILRDADSLVVSENGGVYQIQGPGLHLRNNHKDVVVEPFAGSHSGYIKQTILETTGSGLIPPRLNQITAIGIQADDVFHLNIGDASASTLFNTFDRMTLGIKTTRTSSDIVNNRFNNIQQTAIPSCCISTCQSSIFCGPTGVAIWVIGFKPPSTFFSNIGGTGAFQPNIITNCSNGIRADNTIDLNINNNDITLLTNFISSSVGILVLNNVSNTPAHNILIQNNDLHRFKIGVSTRFTNFSNLDIINNSIISNAPGVNSTGIKCQDALDILGHVNIQGNTINETWLGIVGIGLYNFNINKGSQPTGNQISLTSTVSNNNANLYGIWTQNCMQGVVASNTVTKGGVFLPNATNAAGKWLGIRTDNCGGMNVDKNTISNLGSGIYVFQANNGVNYSCNDLISCWYGVNFSSAAINSQYPGNIAQANAFTSIPVLGSRLAGSVVITSPLTRWNYRLTIPSCFPDCNPLPSPALTPGTLNITTSGVPLTDICPSLPNFAFNGNPNAAEREQILGDIVRNLRLFSANDLENRYSQKQFAYHLLKQHQNWLSCNDPSDTTFQNFFATADNNNLGQLFRIRNRILMGDLVTATNWNNSVSPSNMMESNRQTVNTIYLNSVALDDLSFSSADSTTLYNIAVQDPLVGGDAVYSARVMLDMLVFDEGNGGNNRTMPQETDANPFEMTKVYPNPNDGNMSLDYILPEGSIGELLILDLTGKKINSYRLSEGQNTLKIEAATLENGVYLYRMVINGELKFADKLVIIK